MTFPLTGLAHYWSLDDLTGARVDSVGGLDLTAHNGVGIGPGKIKIGASLTATSAQYLSHPDPLPLGDESFTFAIWFKRASLGDSHMLVGKDQPSGRDYFVTVEPAGAISFSFMHDGGLSRIVTPPIANDLAWHFVLASYDADADLMSLRADNGTPVTLATVNGPWAQAGALCFGARVYPGFEWYFNGVLDEIAQWRGRVLTAAEGSALWNGGAGLALPAAPPASSAQTMLSAIRDRILSVPEVVALVGDRVTLLLTQQSPASRSIRLQEISREDYAHLRGADDLRPSRIQVDVFVKKGDGDAYAVAHAINDAVRGDFVGGVPTGLVGFRGVIGDVNSTCITGASTREMFDPDELQVVRLLSEYFVWFKSGSTPAAASRPFAKRELSHV